MVRRKRLFVVMMSLFVILAFTAIETHAGGNEYDRVVKQLKTRYQAKKVKIPFMWLARFAVKVVRPAGVKSFSVTLFEDLKFSGQDVDREMQAVMRESFGPEWQPILRVRQKSGQQAYMYMRDAGENSVKIAFLSIDNGDAAVIRATVNPDKLAEFMDNPRIFGVSIGDGGGKKESVEVKSSEVPPVKQ